MVGLVPQVLCRVEGVVNVIFFFFTLFTLFDLISMWVFFLLSTDLSVCEAYLLELNHLLQSMEVLHRTYSAPSIQALQVSTSFLIPFTLTWRTGLFIVFVIQDED